MDKLDYIITMIIMIAVMAIAANDNDAGSE